MMLKMLYSVLVGRYFLPVTSNSTNILPTANSPIHLSVLHLNIRSLKRYLEELEALFLSFESPPDIICITETWLTDNDHLPSYTLKGYNQFVTKNKEISYGGVMIQVKENCTILRQSRLDFYVAISADIALGRYQFKLVTIYNKPRTNKMDFIEKLNEYLEIINSVSVPVVICGDFDNDTLTTNLVSSKYKNSMIANGFEIQPENPTRVTENSKT